MSSFLNNGTEPCPKCKSERVMSGTVVGKIILAIVLFLFIGSSNLISVMLWPLFFITIPATFFVPLLVLLAPKTNRCRDCSFAWKSQKNKKVAIDQAQ
ncbi:hypothetical protein NQ109_19065 [Priestia megaterium]|uniref:hypothetical protein n=1 Tax=Priestia megaterium TaxID=1404 RepID=UPI00215A9EAF|nr:hypothetical protein [Priestia megaterium]MCR8865032.1 hypothetical protein [Priestia megaterium]